MFKCTFSKANHPFDLERRIYYRAQFRPNQPVPKGQEATEVFIAVIPYKSNLAFVFASNQNAWAIVDVGDSNHMIEKAVSLDLGPIQAELATLGEPA